MARGQWVRKFGLDEPPELKRNGRGQVRQYATMENAMMRAFKRQRELAPQRKAGPTTVYNLRTGKAVAFIYRKYIEVL